MKTSWSSVRNITMFGLITFLHDTKLEVNNNITEFKVFIFLNYMNNLLYYSRHEFKACALISDHDANCEKTDALHN